MKKNKVDVIWGEADDRVSPARSRLQDHGEADGAAGAAAEERARPRHVPGEAHHHRDRRAAARAARHRAGRKLVWTISSDGARRDAEVAAGHGIGAIGIEFACFYRTMGAEVTVVELLPQILPVEDDEIAATRRSASRSRA